MRRTASLSLPAALLLLGGAFLAILGLRIVAGERDKIARREREGTEDAIRTVVDHVRAQAWNPSTPPDEAWTLHATSLESYPLPGEGYGSLLAAQARHIERGGSEEGDPIALYARLVESGEPGWTDFAALRAGALSLRAGRTEEATRFLERAAEAPPEHLDAVEQLPIRLLALYLLVPVDPDRWEPLFLAEAGDGAVVSPLDSPGPDDLILALTMTARMPRRSRALRAAAARVRRGQRALATVPEPGCTVTAAGEVLRHLRGRLEIRDPHALLQGIAVTGVKYLSLEPRSQPPGEREISVALEPPLEGLALRGWVPPSASRPPIAGFIVILVGYGLSAAMALVGLYRALRAAQAQADFLAEVSHELKTPIASVRAMAEFLADGPADDEAKVRDYARRIEGEMGRLGTSVRNVLDAARIERKGRLPVTPRPGDPAAVVETVAAAVGPGLEARGFAFDVHVEPAGRPVLLDEAALQSAVTNLVDNAAKFSGEVKEIEIEARPGKDRYEIVVRDRGRGLDAKDADRLFHRFERGEAVRKDVVPGVGLGLYVVHQIVEAHHGTVAGRPREGGGALFAIDLPFAREGESRS